MINMVAFYATMSKSIITEFSQENTMKTNSSTAVTRNKREIELLHQIEDQMDREDAEKALADPKENISAQEVWKELGL
jgi:hypothetical protein